MPDSDLRTRRSDSKLITGVVRRLVLAALVGVAVLATVASAQPADAEQFQGSQAPTTQSPTTAPPTTQPPTTAAPSTAAPTTGAPTTTPTTEPPTTQPATTAVPTTAVASTQPRATSPFTDYYWSGDQSGGGSLTVRRVAPTTTSPAATNSGTDDDAGLPTVVETAEQKKSPGAPAVSSRSLRRALATAPGQLPRRVLDAATQTVRRLSTGEAVLLGVVTLVSIVLATIAGSTLWWMLHAWRTPQSLVETGFSGPAVNPELSFSLIVPARHEEAVLGETLSKLAGSDHPSFEILAVVGDDDPATAAVAHAAAARHPDRIRVLVDTNRSKNKPKALNTALPKCRGEVVGVFDAEDEVHPQLLRHVDARFTETKADVVQSGIQLMNFQSSWFAVRNVLEYYFWFRSRLHFQARQRFIPLGGNTVFIRTELLRKAGGWDPACLAEDCELGVRLSSMGARVSVAYDPALVTREETPGTVKDFLKQRTRWNQGFIQVLTKGEWRRLPTLRQRLFARYTLATPFLQAFIGVLIPLSLFAIVFIKMPVLAALISFLPMIPMIAVLIVEVVGLREFCRNYGFQTGWRDYLRLSLGTIPYHALLALAAVRAVVRELRGNRGWEKTAHVGAHRAEPAMPLNLERWAGVTDRSA
jgi:cellulose synthase/poly-beta-1,6-N-acetylglucosamine synthase-like glycosyltransferase